MLGELPMNSPVSVARDVAQVFTDANLSSMSLLPRQVSGIGENVLGYE